MRFVLKEYQTWAARQILATLERCRRDWREYKDQTAFALASTTGSGKTVIAATVIEALLHGSDEFDVEADPTAVVLWVSKDPSLNAQTRSRFIECADRIPSGDLVLLDKDYAGESLKTGTVCFINPDKLRDGSLFVKHTDERHVTFWEIINNTVKDHGRTLYMVLDEAHEGMRTQTSTEQTIVQKIINGNGANAPMPILWGISATVKRFNEAMEKAEGRTKRPNVTIDPKAVQASGLLKNYLTLDIPDEIGDFETTMIRDATLDFVDVCDRWEKYREEQGLEKPVVPLLVVQIPNRTEGEAATEKGRQEEAATIHRGLETIRKHWPDLPEDGVAHVLGDSGALEIGAYTIPKVAPQDVQHDHRIRVLIAKDAVSTGWDCPRAEVLVSLRPGNDHTYVTQLLGRMVRTPLAQSTSEDRLNAASCYLPRFNKDTAQVVAEEIMGLREPATGMPTGAAIGRVLFKPVALTANNEVPDDVRTLIEGLPSYAKPTETPRPIKRLLKASQAFAQDGLVPGADKTAHETLFAVLDNICGRHVDLVDAQREQIQTADIRRLLVGRGDDEVEHETTQRPADAATIEDALRTLRRHISTSVVNRYLGRDVQAAINAAVEAGENLSGVDITAIRARVAALGFLTLPEGEPTVVEAVEDAADALTRLWLMTNKAAIEGLPDSRKPTYEAIFDMARQPEATGLTIKTEEQVDSVFPDRTPLPTERLHVLSDPEGNYPLDARMSKNRWERATINQENGLGTLVGWYRNPSAAGPNSLRVVYDDSGRWKSVQPDFVFVHKDGNTIKPSIIDPHGAHQGDALPKFKALAKYADDQGDLFDRIISIGVEKDGVLYGIDMKSSTIRAAVYASAADTGSLKALFDSHGKKYADIRPDL
jgi:type III restriction enzyme